MTEGKYVYCIIPFDGIKKSFGNIGIENTGEVYTIDYKDVAAVVSDSPVKNYELTEHNARTHEHIIRKVMEEHTVVPMSFGMVFKDQKTLTSVLSGAYGALKKTLKAVDNKVELGVKAVLPKDAIGSFEKWSGGKNKNRYVRECESDFIETLSKVAVASKRSKLFSERLVFNASSLVDRDKINAFSELLKKLEEKYKPLKIQYTGPWAPYHFVDIKISARR